MRAPNLRRREPTAYLAVCEGVSSDGRTASTPGQRNDLGGAAGRLDRPDRRSREAVCLHRERLRQFTASEDLYQALLGDEAAAPQRVGADLGAGVEHVERLQVHDVVLDAERVVEALRLRGAPVEGRLATLEPDGHGVARALTLRSAAGGLAALAADAASDPPLGTAGTG